MPGILTRKEAIGILPTSIGAATQGFQQGQLNNRQDQLLGNKSLLKMLGIESNETIADKNLEGKERQIELKDLIGAAAEDRQIQKATDLSKQFPGRSVSIDKARVGSTFNPNTFEKSQNEMARQYAKDLTTNKIPETRLAAEGLKNSIEEKGVAIGNVSGDPNIPAWMVQAAEKFGEWFPNSLTPKSGATEQKQSLEELNVFRRNPLFGTALTEGERASYNSAFGILATGDEEQLRTAMQTMINLYNKAHGNIKSGYPSKVVEMVESRGGTPSSPINIKKQPIPGMKSPIFQVDPDALQKELQKRGMTLRRQ